MKAGEILKSSLFKLPVKIPIEFSLPYSFCMLWLPSLSCSVTLTYPSSRYSHMALEAVWPMAMWTVHVMDCS